MRRRTFLGAVGGTLTVGIVGCLGGETAAATNEFGYPTLEVENVDVPLAPVDDTFDWYEEEAATFVDARSRTAYDAARIVGAVLSPAPEGLEDNDPIRALDPETRIVTYCGCPHHLSTLRAASAVREGHRNVYAIDEGFAEWVNRGYPAEGPNVESPQMAVSIAGVTDSSHQGEYVWLHHDPSGQREAAPIDATGRFAMQVRFYDIDRNAVVRLVAPSGEYRDQLGNLADRELKL